VFDWIDIFFTKDDLLERKKKKRNKRPIINENPFIPYPSDIVPADFWKSIPSPGSGALG